jgi:hypothetical protein
MPFAVPSFWLGNFDAIGWRAAVYRLYIARACKGVLRPERSLVVEGYEHARSDKISPIPFLVGARVCALIRRGGNAPTRQFVRDGPLGYVRRRVGAFEQMFVDRRAMRGVFWRVCRGVTKRADKRCSRGKRCNCVAVPVLNQGKLQVFVSWLGMPEFSKSEPTQPSFLRCNVM